MAREFKLLFVLWLVVACDATTTAVTTPVPTATTQPTTNPSDATTTAVTTPVPTATTQPTTNPSDATTTAVTTPVPTATTQPTTNPSDATTTAVTTPVPTATTQPTTNPSDVTTVSAKPTVPDGTATQPTTNPSDVTTVSAKPTVPDGTVTQPTTNPSDNTTVSAKPTVPDGTATQPTTKPSDPCTPDPCGEGSTCVPHYNQTFECMCLAGNFYDDSLKTCVKASVFPGQLQVGGIPFSETMKDKTSELFQTTSKTITDTLDDVFKNDKTYSGSTVLEIREITSRRVLPRSAKGIDATVDMFFTANADITTEKVKDGIKDYLDKCTSPTCPLPGAVFTDTNLCTRNACDAKTTTCVPGDGSFSCRCQKAYIKTEFSDRVCTACPSGTRASADNTECDACSFGRSGLNCEETWKLAVVVVSTVLGGLLLITLILLPLVARKASKKSSKMSKNVEHKEPFMSHPSAKAPLVNSSVANSQAASANGSANAFANGGMPRIPRATTTSSWDRTNLEMTPSNSRQNLVPTGRNARLYEDQDDMAPYALSRPQSSLYGQARPQSNPYAQKQPQVNPYASSQGHSNPYYRHDDGRRFN